METYQVAMGDGVRLATDIYLPEGPGPWPVLVLGPSRLLLPMVTPGTEHASTDES